jgi:hypothetical protein
MTPKIDQVVYIIKPTTGLTVSTATVKSVSPSGKVVTLIYEGTHTRRKFFRLPIPNDATYVFQPSAGLCGRSLNDRFYMTDHRLTVPPAPAKQGSNSK